MSLKQRKVYNNASHLELYSVENPNKIEFMVPEIWPF